MTGVQINLVRCTDVILRDIACKQATQKDVALTYAMAIKSEHRGADKPDWRTINAAIVARWPKGLHRVKKRAWDLVDGKIHP